MSEELNQLNELSTTQTDHEYGGAATACTPTASPPLTWTATG